MSNKEDKYIEHLERILTHSNSNLAMYEYKFKGKNKNKREDLLDFREYLLESREDLTLDFFKHCMSVIGLHRTMEDIILLPYTFEEINILRSNLKEKPYVLEVFLEDFNKNPNMNIWKYIL